MTVCMTGHVLHTVFLSAEGPWDKVNLILIHVLYVKKFGNHDNHPALMLLWHDHWLTTVTHEYTMRWCFYQHEEELG